MGHHATAETETARFEVGERVCVPRVKRYACLGGRFGRVVSERNEAHDTYLVRPSSPCRLQGCRRCEIGVSVSAHDLRPC
jgi:hypothetical protein